MEPVDIARLKLIRALEDAERKADVAKPDVLAVDTAMETVKTFALATIALELHELVADISLDGRPLGTARESAEAQGHAR